MPQLVCMGAVLKCSQGNAPAPLIVLQKKVTGILPYANNQDYKPILNVTVFGMCRSLINPLVIASLGKPVPCIPVITKPWDKTAKKVTVRGKPAVTKESTLQCLWNGSIKVDFPGQPNVTGK